MLLLSLSGSRTGSSSVPLRPKVGEVIGRTFCWRNSVKLANFGEDWIVLWQTRKKRQKTKLKRWSCVYPLHLIVLLFCGTFYFRLGFRADVKWATHILANVWRIFIKICWGKLIPISLAALVVWSHSSSPNDAKICSISIQKKFPSELSLFQMKRTSKSASIFWFLIQFSLENLAQNGLRKEKSNIMVVLAKQNWSFIVFKSKWEASFPKKNQFCCMRKMSWNFHNFWAKHFHKLGWTNNPKGRSTKIACAVHCTNGYVELLNQLTSFFNNMFQFFKKGRSKASPT